MPQTFDDLKSAALTLSEDERAKLAHELLESIHQVSDEEFDAVWAVEAERRIRAVREGKAKRFPGEQVQSEIRKLIES